MASYTREELEAMRRSEIRTLAVSDEFGMSPKEAVSAASKDLIEFIMSKQGGEKAAKPGKAGKAAKPAPAPEPEEAPEEAPEEETPPPASSKSSKKEEAGIVTRIDKLGITLDEVEKKLTGEVGTVQQQVYVLMAMVKLMLQTTDLEPKDIDDAITRATEEFEEQGKGE
jgi:hypothetical protein